MGAAFLLGGSRVIYSILTLMIYFTLALVCACVIHEGGHVMAARIFGKRLKFRFELGYITTERWQFPIPIPRFVWTMPFFFEPENWKQKVIALAGFGAEFLAVPIFYAFMSMDSFAAYYGCVTIWHFVLYWFYAGEDSDFRWI